MSFVCDHSLQLRIVEDKVNFEEAIVTKQVE